MQQWSILIPAIGAFLMAAASYLKSRTNSAKLDQGSAKLDQVHELVNSQLTEALERVEQLRTTLEHAEIKVPPAPDVGSG
jgi:hypothetical protein